MIYLDHAAATPLSDVAREAMRPFEVERFFNPSAAYLPAVELRREYEVAKDRIAHVIGAKGVDLVITAGATESIGLAFQAICSEDYSENGAGVGASSRATATSSLPPSSRTAKSPRNSSEQIVRILISAVEHPAVVANAEKCVSYDTIRVDQFGRVDLTDLRRKLTAGTELVSVCLASGELGTIQPITEIAEIVRVERQRRALAGEKTPIYLHCDASQGLGLMEVKVNRLGVDMLTLNAAKLYGPKGVGALWVGHGVRLTPVLYGGGQERGLRSGTENVTGVMGFATAAEEAEKQMKGELRRLAANRRILRRLLGQNASIKFLGNEKIQLVNFLPIVVEGVDAERLIFKLEAHGVYVATGAACAASRGERSATLAAIGLSEAEIAGSLRITLGRLNTENDMREAGRLILAAVAEEQARSNGGKQ